MTSYVRGLCEVLYVSWVAIVILPCVIIYSFARDPVVRVELVPPSAFAMLSKCKCWANPKVRNVSDL
jgi:hypothetical protein